MNIMKLEWVDVDERVPQDGEAVLATGFARGKSSTGKRWTEIAQRCTDGDWETQGNHDKLFSPTHWMPLPLGPNGERT